jgi:hypothetical protein
VFRTNCRTRQWTFRFVTSYLLRTINGTAAVDGQNADSDVLCRFRSYPISGPLFQRSWRSFCLKSLGITYFTVKHLCHLHLKTFHASGGPVLRPTRLYCPHYSIWRPTGPLRKAMLHRHGYLEEASVSCIPISQDPLHCGVQAVPFVARTGAHWSICKPRLLGCCTDLSCSKKIEMTDYYLPRTNLSPYITARSTPFNFVLFTFALAVIVKLVDIGKRYVTASPKLKCNAKCQDSKHIIDSKWFRRDGFKFCELFDTANTACMLQGSIHFHLYLIMASNNCRNGTRDRNATGIMEPLLC